MADERFDERTEPATPRRRQEARERGHVARSADLSSAVILLAAVLALEFLGRGLVQGLFAGASSVLEGLAEVDGDRAGLSARFAGIAWAAFLGVLPIVAIVVLAALAASLFQVGFLLTGEGLVPKFEKLNPVEGFRRIFSLRSLVRLATGLLKVAAVGAVVFWTIWAERARLVTLSARGFEEIVAVGTELMFVVSIRAVLALLVLGILEYGYQRWQYEKDLRMTKQELREELRRYEGDPKIRERRRSVQRQLAMQRMMLQVPRATVVITNPTHVSVALEYEPGKMEAPLLVAKGAELLAHRIREIALEHGVPIVERPDLARALYRGAEVGQPVPVDLYQAVAEVMAYVYRLKGMAAVA